MSDNQRLCSYCHQYKTRVWTQKKLRDGSKLYVDENNSRWAGKRCPDCERKRVRAALKCTPFERSLIVNELRKQGYEVLTDTFPLKVRKDGQDFSVGVRYASTKEGQIVLEEDGIQHREDLYMLIFASTRLLSKDQIERLHAPVVPKVTEGSVHQSMVSRAGSEVLG